MTKTKKTPTKPASTITTEAYTFIKPGDSNREFNLIKLTIEDGVIVKEEVIKTDLPMIVMGKIKQLLLARLLELKDGK